jgi:hypothetical protein
MILEDGEIHRLDHASAFRGARKFCVVLLDFISQKQALLIF